VQNQMKMMQQVQKMQARMAQVQTELEATTVDVASGGGAVKAVVSGQQHLVSIQIDPEVVDDTDMLQDLILAAVNEGLDRSRELAASRMQAVTAELGLPPGLI